MPGWVTPVVALIATVFSAGITWGIFSYRQKHNENAQTDLVKDLKECVTKLQTVVTDVEVMKAASARYERQSGDLDKRVIALEITVAKMTPARTRKR